MSNLMRMTYLHPLVYFVADKPTKDNVSPDVPLVGTKSYRTLLNWIGEMDIDIMRVRMYNQVDNPFGNFMSQASLNRAIQLGQIRVVALGQKAATYLNKAGITNHYLMLHPSGRNRLLNDPIFVKMKLENCKAYIYKGELNGV